MKSKTEISPEKLPRHVAIIMDGNRRWATKRLLPKAMGHNAGVKTLIKIVKHAVKSGVPYVTVYAFSTENKNRPKEEVDTLIDLIRKNFETVFAELIENDVCVRIVGDREYFPTDVIEILNKVESDSAGGKGGVFNVALNYGARAEIVRAAKAAAESGEEITEENFGKFLYTFGSPDPDMIIRTGGEKRLSNFLLYQSAYAELFFTDTLWPDFTENELDLIIAEFGKRNRRFGKV